MLILSASGQASSLINSNPEKDTVIINFGNNSKIVLYIEDKEDLNKLTQYDINKMLQELNLNVENMDDSVQILTIEEEDGSKYLKDTTIIYSGTYSKTQVEPGSESYDYDDSKRRKRYEPKSRFHFNVDVGLNNYVEDGKSPDGNALYKLNTGGSWYWGFEPTMHSNIVGPLFIDWGGGIGINVHRFQNNATRLVKDPSGLVFTTETRPEVANIKSKLATWHLQVKAVPMLAFPSNKHRSYRLWNRVDKGFRFGAGPYVGYRIWTRTKAKYKENGDKRKDKTHSDYFLNDLRYGIRGQIGIGGFDVFFMWDLNEMFQANQGAPSLNRFQFGITF